MVFMTFLALAAMGCTGDTQNNDSDTSSVNDSGESDFVTVILTPSVDIDETCIDPVPICAHEPSGETGHEAQIGQATTSGKPIEALVPKENGIARLWVGLATGPWTNDGHRLLEFTYDGFDRWWVHPIADVPAPAEACGSPADRMVNDACEPVVHLNGYVPYDLYHCEMDVYEQDASASDYKGDYIYTSEGDFLLDTVDGMSIVDTEGGGLEGFLGPETQSLGSGFVYDSGDSDVWTNSSSWLGNGFTMSVIFYDVSVEDLTCTVK